MPLAELVERLPRTGTAPLPLVNLLLGLLGMLGILVLAVGSALGRRR